MGDFEDRLSRALATGADGAPDAGGLASAARDRRRKRRRRAVLASVAAAVVAIAVPTAVFAGGGRDGAVPAPAERPTDPPQETEVTCGGEGRWPVSVMDGGLDGVVDDAAVRAAFADVLAEAPMDAPRAIRERGADEAPYIVLASEGDEVTVGTGTWTMDGPGRDGDVLTFERGSSPNVSGWGDCQELTVASPPGRSRVGLTPLSGQPVEAGATTLTVIARETQCTSGRDPGPHLGDPAVVETDDRVIVTLTSELMAESANCVGNPSTPVTVQLDEPIGDRTVYDGGTWPPTPIDLAVADPSTSDVWHAETHNGVEILLPADWTAVDCPSASWIVFGPPDGCAKQVGVAFYDSAVFDPAYGPGEVRQERSTGAWGGHVNVGDTAVWVSATMRSITLRILDSVWEE